MRFACFSEDFGEAVEASACLVVWHPTKAEAIAAFERASKRKGIRPPLWYPPGVSGDSITTNDLAYPRHTCDAGMRDGHGWVYVEARDN